MRQQCTPPAIATLRKKAAEFLRLARACRDGYVSHEPNRLSDEFSLAASELDGTLTSTSPGNLLARHAKTLHEWELTSALSARGNDPMKVRPIDLRRMASWSSEPERQRKMLALAEVLEERGTDVEFADDSVSREQSSVVHAPQDFSPVTKR